MHEQVAYYSILSCCLAPSKTKIEHSGQITPPCSCHPGTLATQLMWSTPQSPGQEMLRTFPCCSESSPPSLSLSPSVAISRSLASLAKGYSKGGLGVFASIYHSNYVFIPALCTSSSPFTTLASIRSLDPGRPAASSTSSND